MPCSRSTCTHSFRKGTSVMPPISQQQFAPGLDVSFPWVPGRVRWEPLGRNVGEGATCSQPHLILLREVPVPSPTPSPALRHLHSALQPVPQCELASPRARRLESASQPPPSVLPDAPAPGTRNQIPHSSSSPDPRAAFFLSPLVLPSPAPPEPSPSLHLHPSPLPGRGRALASRGWEGP